MSRSSSLLMSSLYLEDCPICLDPLMEWDSEHPLQCQNRCGYNFCKRCIASLITSSKDPYMEASDGNLHVKVYLHCPNCRSDLGDSIRHTLLLRKVDESLAKEDNTLSDSELKFRAAIETLVVKQAVQEAQEMEAKYLKLDDCREDDDEENDESWGVEADIVQGAHESFHIPASSSKPQLPNMEAIQIDSTLLGGFQHLLWDHECIQLTELMTSGDAEKLVEAAMILHGVAEKCCHPYERTTGTYERTTKQTRAQLSRNSSVFDLIEEAKNVRSAKFSASGVTQFGGGSRTIRQSLYSDPVCRSYLLKNFPLPVRMPKVFELDLTRPLEMKFLSHHWDGTVMDAYCKISIGFGNRITQRRTPNERVRRILGEHSGDVQIELPDQHRILVHSVGRFGGRKGIVRGDVVTHVDGEILAGKSVDELMILLAKKKPQGKVMVTFNAERSTAEALRRRALAMSEI